MSRSSKANRAAPRAGFTLLEVLAALAVTAALVAVVLPFAGRLATRWWIGEAGVEAADAWMQAMARLSDDLSQAVPVPIQQGDKTVAAFEAGSDFVAFVRPTLGEGAGGGIETVRFAIRSGPAGRRLVRQSRRFDPLTFFDAALRLGDPVTLVDAPYPLRFATIGRDEVARPTWPAGEQAPAAIELMVDAPSSGAMPPSPMLFPVAARRLTLPMR